jgi:hypothetical protein
MTELVVTGVVIVFCLALVTARTRGSRPTHPADGCAGGSDSTWFAGFSDGGSDCSGSDGGGCDGGGGD